jgi:unsaturated rhamnogalacturonyl hydrolase
MKRIFTLVIGWGICIAATAQANRGLTVAAGGQNWQLVWSDEFNYTGLPDKHKWEYEEGFVRNQEPQYYTVGRSENARVENGSLVIEARKESYPNAAYKPGSAQPAEAEYTSASLVTLDKESWKYGRIEVRAKVPGGLGSWPAIWLLGEDRGAEKWPFCGEVDIMEYLGRDPSKVYGTVHYANTEGKYNHQGESPVVGNPSDGYHVYALNWYPDRLEFYYDSLKYLVFDINKAYARHGNIFQKNFYLLLNLALGHQGSWAGPFSDNELPMRYYVDYVRVYKEEAASAGVDSTLGLMKKVGDWQLNDWAQHGMRYRGYDWVNAVCYTGLFALGQVSGDRRYCDALRAVGDSLDWNTGPHRGMADDYCIAQAYAQLYGMYKDPRMIAHFRSQADSICALPHTESLDWKNHIQNREWAWCDALYMGPPGLAYLSSVTGDPKYLAEADSLWWKTTDYLFDKKEDLYFRDERYFNQHEANGTKMFWSRGNGWVMGGLVRMLSNMPADFADRPRFIRLYKEMAEKIAVLQQSDGTWHTSLLDPGSYPNEETSGTGLYCYALAWGINHGILSRKHYLPVVMKSWNALKAAVHPDGMLGYVQKIGDKPGAADANSTEAYGPGAFLLAGSEMLKMR